MNNCQCLKSELSIFDKHPVQTVILKGNFEEMYPLNPLVDDGPIEFNFTSSDSDMFDLNDTMLEIRGKVIYTDGSVLDATDNQVKPINLFLHSLFSDVSIYLNEQKIEGGNYLYPYYSFFTNYLQHTKEYKSCQLNVAGLEPTHNDIIGSKPFQYIGHLSSPFFAQGRYMLNQSQIRVKLNRHKPTFCIENGQALPAGKNDYKISLSHAILHVRRCQISPSVLLGHEEGLIKKQLAIYPMQHVEMLTYTISQGLSSVSHDNILVGQSPKLIVFGLVSNDGFNGTYTTNPFKFEHFDMQVVTLYVNGEPITHKLDFDNKLCKRQYMSMFQSLEMNSDSNGITYDQWLNDKTLFVYNLCPDLSFDGEHGQVKNRPNIRLELQFKKPLPKSVNVVIMSITDGIVSINKDRQVFNEF